MKITVGGSVGFKIQAKQYESIDASSIFSIEKEFPNDQKINQKELDLLSDKTTKRLMKDVSNKLNAAIETYNTKIKEYKNLINTL